MIVNQSTYFISWSINSRLTNQGSRDPYRKKNNFQGKSKFSTLLRTPFSSGKRQSITLEKRSDFGLMNTSKRGRMLPFYIYHFNPNGWRPNGNGQSKSSLLGNPTRDLFTGGTNVGKGHLICMANSLVFGVGKWPEGKNHQGKCHLKKAICSSDTCHECQLDMGTCSYNNGLPSKMMAIPNLGFLSCFKLLICVLWRNRISPETLISENPLYSPISKIMVTILSKDFFKQLHRCKIVVTVLTYDISFNHPFWLYFFIACHIIFTFFA